MASRNAAERKHALAFVEKFERELEAAWLQRKRNELTLCHNELTAVLEKYPRIVRFSAIRIYENELIEEILKEVRENPIAIDKVAITDKKTVSSEPIAIVEKPEVAVHKVQEKESSSVTVT